MSGRTDRQPSGPASTSTSTGTAPGSGSGSIGGSSGGGGGGGTSSGILGSSAVMAAGTVVSRGSGFVRTALLAAALGPGLHADIFNIANTIPNMLYILLAGGIFNAVLVPQLVRAMRDHDDSGEAYTNRVITLAALFLALVSVLLVAAAPWVMRLFLDPSYGAADMTAQRDSVVAFARYCLPQVFFYGMFVLVGQILNARGRFGPMMWAPIANNVIAVLVLVAYLVVYGPAAGVVKLGGFTSHQELLLGLGSTLGIVAQFLILLPFLRRAGFTYRPRFDFRGTGLGHTLHLGVWTVLFVVVNQIAYTVVVRLASGGTAGPNGADGTGYTIYSSTFLLVTVPHSVVTVSLATAVLPTLSARAADADLSGLATTLASTLRTALVLVVPFVALLPVIALDLSRVVWGHGASSGAADRYAPSLVLFGPGLLLFTVHYLMLRGFYALERTRTVFYIQCAVSATNIVLAVLLVHAASARNTSPALVVAYAGAYLVGACTSYLLLSRVLGGLATRRLVRFVVRVVIAAGVAAAAAYAVSRGLHALDGHSDFWTSALAVLVAGAVDLLVFLVLCELFRLREASEVVRVLTRRRSGAHTR